MPILLCFHVQIKTDRQTDIKYLKEHGDILPATLAFSSRLPQETYKSKSSLVCTVNSRLTELCKDIVSKTNKCFLCEHIHLLKTMMHLSLSYSTDYQAVFQDCLLWHMLITQHLGS